MNNNDSVIQKKMGLNPVFKKVNESLIDVFCGVGWNQWSRFEVKFENGRGVLKLVKGRPMEKAEFRQLYQEIFT